LSALRRYVFGGIMKLVDDFLNEFCAIEKYIRELTRSNDYKPFNELLNEAKVKNRVIYRYASELASFAKLRNLLSHDRIGGEYVAIPSQHVVDKIHELNIKIISQPKLQALCSKVLLAFDKCTTIQQVLLDMREQDFSQVPITFEGSLYGVLSANTIARWLGSDETDGLFCTSEATIEEVMRHQECVDNYVVLSKDENYGKAVAEFEKATAQGKQLDAILVTHSGRPEQKLLGVITMADIPKIISELY